MATALAWVPDLPQQWLSGDETVVEPVQPRWKDKSLTAAATQAMVRHRLARLGAGRDTRAPLSPVLALLRERLHRHRALRRYRRWYAREDHAPRPSTHPTPAPR